MLIRNPQIIAMNVTYSVLYKMLLPSTLWNIIFGWKVCKGLQPSFLYRASETKKYFTKM